jgi:DNA-directed RNA polymerase beta' subunit
MIFSDFSKPLIFIDLGGFVNKLRTSSKIKATGQRTLLSKSSFVTSLFGDTSYLRKGQTTDQCSGRRSVFKNEGFSKVQAFKNDFKSISGLSTEIKPTMDFNLSPSAYNKKIYTSYSKLSEVKLLTIGIASPLRILQWAEKTLPNGKIYGEVLNANTLHHKTFKPQKGGLFCERIFGPLKDFECACGKIDKSIKYDLRSLRAGTLASAQKREPAQSAGQSSLPEGCWTPTVFEALQKSAPVEETHQLEPSEGVRLSDLPLTTEGGETKQTTQVSKTANTRNIKNRKYCPECDVEYTWSVIRRYQLGYIKLNSPVTHVWFLKGTPSYLSILLDFKKRHLQNVTYCSETLTVENALFQNNKLLLLDSPSKIFTTWQSLVNKSTLPSSTSSNPLLKTTLDKNFQNKESTSQIADSSTQHSMAAPVPLAKGGTMTSSFVQAQEKLRHRRVLHQQLSPFSYSEKGTTPLKKWCQNITSPISQNNSIKKGIAQFPESDADKYKEIPYLSEVKKSQNKLSSYSQRSSLSNEVLQSKTLAVFNRLQTKGATTPSGPSSAFSKGLVCASRSSPSTHRWYSKPSVLKEKSQSTKSAMKVNTALNKSSQPFLLSGSSFLPFGCWQLAANSAFAKANFAYGETHTNENTSNTKMLDVKKGSFLLSFLQLSVYYNSSLLKSKNYVFASSEVGGVPPTSTPFGKDVQKPSIFEESAALAPFPSLPRFAQGRKRSEGVLKTLRVQSFLKEKTSYTSTLKEISQKLPIDLYILSSLERVLHKQALLLSINKTWEKIYKKAYFNAMHKAMKIAFFQKTSFVQNPDLLVGSNLNFYEIQQPKGREGYQKTALVPHYAPFGKAETTRKSILASFYKRKKTEAYKTSAQNINLVLKMIKKDFSNHILMALKNLKQPVLALKHTTQIKNSNAQTKFKVSEEIEQYLILNTEPITKLLSDVFLKSFLVGNFLEKMSFSVNNQNRVNFALDKGSANFKANNYNTKKDIASKFPNNSLNLYKNLIRFQKFQKTSVSNVVSLPPFSPKAKKAEQGESSAKKVQSVFAFGTVRGSVMNHDCLPLGKANEESKRLKKETQHLFNSMLAFCPSFTFQGKITRGNAALSQKERAKKYVSFDLSESMRKSENFDNKNKVYNNVYVLSHRERWSSEKDWQLFSLYNSGISEYTDMPIHTYKNRLSLNWEFQLFSELTSTALFGFPAEKRRAQPKAGERFAPISKGVQVQTEQKPKLKTIKTKEEFTVNYTLSSAFYSGAGIVQQLLNELNFAELKKLDKQNRLLLYQLNKTIFSLKKQAQFFIYKKSLQLELRELCKKRDFLMRRTKLVRKFFRKDSDPSSMVLTVLPVLPPDLRPIVKMGNQIAASDLNRLYQRVIYRNDRLKKFLKDPATSHSYEMKYAQRLLQEAVDNLIQNGKSGVNSEKDSRGRLLKSLSDLLKGKQGRFRQFLLGKRVDYSGRSVIVVGPKLKLYECGLPLEMAKELYLPFLLKSILNKNYARTVVGAKSLIKNNPALAHELLRDIMRVSPVFLNRAPTLHRLGIQAFVPKLVEGRAILLHPLVCSAFNADFDGDQMAVHVPITVEARAEAWKLMLARNNIFSPATGDPLAIPSQDMVLGCYFLTTYSNQNNALLRTARRSGSGLFFNNLYDVLNTYNRQKIHLHALVWVKWLDSIENGSDQEEPIEIRMSSNGHWQEISANYHRFYDSNNILISQYMATTPGRILFNLLIQKILFLREA